MNKIQLDNIIIFSFLFVERHITTYDPTYICEKWDSFIDIDVMKVLETKRQETLKYESVWGEIKDNEIYTKVYICVKLEMLKAGQSFILENIIKLFEEFIDLNDISKIEAHHYHPKLGEFITRWRNRPLNDVLYQTYMRDNIIDSLLTD